MWKICQQFHFRFFQVYSFGEGQGRRARAKGKGEGQRAKGKNTFFYSAGSDGLHRLYGDSAGELSMKPSDEANNHNHNKAMPTAVFSARGITRVYRMGEVDVYALRGVDLELMEGEFVVLVGPSGSGKSTLLNILGALDQPSSGSVWYRDSELTKMSEWQLTQFRRNHVGFVFQFYNLIPSLTAEENIALVTEICKHPMSPLEALDLVGLADRRHHFPSQLSGGEQQRVAIARAIAKQPGVLLCDEPTGALDVKTGVRVLEVIQRVNEELGTTTAVITHNAMIAEMADRVVSLSDGQIASERRNPNKMSPHQIQW
jgi:putative ABC transport system ATP-binding protein